MFCLVTLPMPAAPRAAILICGCWTPSEIQSN